jgi:hypothetical protein
MDDVVHGDCDERFDGVRAALADNIASGEEVGACIAVDVDGETFVDIWGGFTDGARPNGRTKDTIVNVWSSTKTVTSLAGLMLIGWCHHHGGGARVADANASDGIRGKPVVGLCDWRVYSAERPDRCRSSSVLARRRGDHRIRAGLDDRD